MSDSVKDTLTGKLEPFDGTLCDHQTMYDQLPYVRNYDECNSTTVAKYSGNVLKYYRCNINDPFEIQNRDEEMAKKLSKLRKEQLFGGTVEQTVPEESGERGLTDQQMDELFRDNGSEE